MQTSNNGINLIKRFEGLRLSSYICAAGYPTIGYGHVIKRGEDFSAGIDEARAVELLRGDVQASERAVRRLINVTLNQNQFDALVSFTFNLGAGALQRSTLRQKLNRGEYHQAAPEFNKWVFANGRKLRGLQLRRKAEVELFMRLPWLS